MKNHEADEDRETQIWLAMLSGETMAGADSRLVLEAEALRAVLECRRQPPPLNPDILNNVIVQLQQEGLLRPNQGVKDWWKGMLQQVMRVLSEVPQWSWQWRVGWSFAFVVLLAIIILPPFLKSPAPELTERGTGSSVCFLVDANPPARMAQLQTDLAKIGVSKTVVTTRGPTQRIDVEVTSLANTSMAELEVFLNKLHCQGWTTGSTLQAIVIMPEQVK